MGVEPGNVVQLRNSELEWLAWTLVEQLESEIVSPWLEAVRQAPDRLSQFKTG